VLLTWDILNRSKKEGKMHHRLIFLIILASMFLIYPTVQNLPAQEAPTQVGGNEVLAIGVSRILGDNLAQARQNAISSAISKGLEYYLLRKLGREVVRDHLDSVVDGILPRAKELVEYYHVIKEAELGERYTLLLQLRINEKLLTDRLQEEGLATTETKPIRVLFLVGDGTKGATECWWTKPEEIPPLSPVELVLFRAFQKRGFDLIDRTVSLPSEGFTPDMKQTELSPMLIAKWGRIFGADVVVYGKGEMSDTGQVSMRVQVLGVADEVVHCQMDESGSAVAGGGSQEIVTALEGVVNQMMPRLLVCLNRAGGGRQIVYHTFEVTLKGLDSYMQYKKLREFMGKKIPGVRELKQSRIGSHYVSFRVEFQGDEEKFANLVMYHDALPVPIKVLEQKQGEVVFLVGDK